ncbi:MAG: hypothetical protein HYZ83_02255 [Candidatus Omnitrophica bacterium]|nr:hypothetical protein [Candidatus Omnitrophota bacterium]
MDIYENWEKALKNTEIIRPRVLPLATYEATHLPYIFLAESAVNLGDTVVRKGEIVVDRPSIILPSHLPQFEGFDEEGKPALDYFQLTNLLLVRGVRFPSLKYNNKVHSLDLCEKKLGETIEDYRRRLEKEENIATGLIVGLEDSWQFSVLIFICGQMIKSADGDIRKLLDDFKKNS